MRPPGHASMQEGHDVRIAIIAHLKYAISEPFAGGLEVHTHMLASGLRARGHDVTLFASTHSDPALGVEAICEETALLATGVAEANDVAFFREHHAYLGLMHELRRRSFDVIHNNSLHYLPVSMADTLDIPMLTTLHTPPFCWLESGIRHARADIRYVAVSQAMADLWSPVTQVHGVVPNGIDLDLFPFRATAGAEPYLVWYGRLVPEKGVEFAIEAARLVDIPLRIAGPISDQAYFDEVVGPKLSGLVRYEGHLARDALAQLVGGARAALCTPLWEEPYGLVVAEALACGTPVAAFRRGGIPGILDDRCGVLADPDSAESLASAAFRAMALNRADCRQRAADFCDVDCMVDAYEAHYEEMLLAGHIDAQAARIASASTAIRNVA